MRALLAFLFCAAAFAEMHERRVTVDGAEYVVSYTLQQQYGYYNCTTPATFPPGPAHCAADITVFELRDDLGGAPPPPPHRVQIGTTFSGQYVEGGCFEDRPEDMVSYALKHKDEPKPEEPDQFKSSGVGGITGPVTSGSATVYIAGSGWVECNKDQVDLNPTRHGEVVVIKARVCKDGKWVSAKVRVE